MPNQGDRLREEEESRKGDPSFLSNRAEGGKKKRHLSPTHSADSTGPGNNACTWFGEVCSCCCLPLLPQLACNMPTTTYRYYLFLGPILGKQRVGYVFNFPQVWVLPWYAIDL